MPCATALLLGRWNDVRLVFFAQSDEQVLPSHTEGGDFGDDQELLEASGGSVEVEVPLGQNLMGEITTLLKSILKVFGVLGYRRFDPWPGWERLRLVVLESFFCPNGQFLGGVMLHLCLWKFWDEVCLDILFRLFVLEVACGVLVFFVGGVWCWLSKWFPAAALVISEETCRSRCYQNLFFLFAMRCPGLNGTIEYDVFLMKRISFFMDSMLCWLILVQEKWLWVKKGYFSKILLVKGKIAQPPVVFEGFSFWPIVWQTKDLVLLIVFKK